MEPSLVGIKIKTLDNALHEMEVSQEMTVINLKTLIEDIMKVPVPKQRLIFHGRLLIDSEKLSKYKIEDGHVLHLVANPIEASSTHNQETNSLNAQTQVETRNSNNTNEIDILTGIIRTINQTSLNRRNLRRRLMQQRSNGFTIEINESMGIIKQNFQSLSMIMENTTKFSELASIKNLKKDSFINPFNFSNRKLHLGQWIDVKDTIDQWLEAQVVKVQNNQVYLHYNGWGNRWDEWLDMNSPRIALFRTYTVQSPHSLYMSPHPINQPDGDLNENNEPKFEAQDFLFDLSSMLNKLTADIIELGKLMNNKKIKEKEVSNLIEEKEEVKINPNEDTIPVDVKINLLNSQLAPILDRVGRLMIDLAPHLALQGSEIQTIYVPESNTANSNINNNGQSENVEVLQKTHVFQVPVMLNPGEILSINNLGDRGNLDNDFPRSAIIIGSRISTENINENSNENRNEEEQEESNNQIINESTPLLDHNSGNNLTNNEQNQIKEEEEEINKQKKPEIAKIGIEEEILNEKIEEKVKQTEDPLKTEEKQDFNLDKENIINIENSENNFEKLEQEKNSNE